MPAHRTTQLDLTPAQRRCVDTLDAHNGNRTAAADALGMDLRSFRRRLAEAVERGADLPEPADAAPIRKPRRIEVKLDDLVLSRDLQPRVGLDDATVGDYAALYRDRGPTAMDPIRAYAREDGRPILTRGFTRVAGARLAGLDALPCDLYAEADDEAMLRDSLSGNRHGLRLTNADKRRALKLYHERIARRRWDSTREVAVLLGCSHELVAAFRKELTAPKPATDTPPAAKPAPEVGKGAKSEAKPAQPSAGATPPTDEIPATDGPEEVTDPDTPWPVGSEIQHETFGRGTVLAYEDAGQAVRFSFGTHGEKVMLVEFCRPKVQPWVAESQPPKASPEITGAKPDPKPRTLAERRLERERELVCQRILEQPGNIAPGYHRELALLLLIVGVDSDPKAVWNDAELSDAEARWDATIASRVTTEIRAGNPHLPDLATIARLWQIDADAIRIQAQRAVPS